MKKNMMNIIVLFFLVLFPIDGFTLGGLGVGGFAGGGAYSSKFLLYQNFENTGATGWDNGETWSAAGSGSYNSKYASSPAPLRGSQSLFVSTGSAIYEKIYKSLAADKDNIYVRVLFRPVTLPTNSNQHVGIFRFAESTYTHQMMRVWVTYVSSNTYTFSIDDGVSFRMAISDPYSSFTSHTYTLWIETLKGTGTDSIHRLFVAVDSTTKPASPTLEVTNGVCTYQVHEIDAYLAQSSSVTSEVIYDQIIVNDSAIGSGDEP